MKKRNFDRNNAYTGGGAKLPEGAYICKIMKVEEVEGTNGNSDYWKVYFDIAEGEFANYYADKYKADDRNDKKWSGVTTVWMVNEKADKEKQDWTQRRLDTILKAIEDSNEGYTFDWDEKKLKNKLFGGVFVYEIYNGHTFAKLYDSGICSVDDIKNGTYYTPKAKTGTATANSSDDGFMNVSDEDESLPFA